MADTVSRNDMETISNGVLRNYAKMEDLPENLQQALEVYWEESGTFEEVDQASAQRLQELREARAQSDLPFYLKPLEWLGSKMYAAYSATISPAISAGAMAFRSVVRGGRPEYVGTDGGNWFERELDAYKDYWDVAHHVSPGQAVWMIGLSDEQLKERGIRPDQIAANKELLKKEAAAHQRDIAAGGTGTLTQERWDYLNRSQEYFNSGAAKYVTGATDFAVSWYADPVILAGYGAGALKATKVTRPIATQIAKEERAIRKAQPGLDELDANALAWENFSTKQPFQGIADQVMKIKAANPDTAAAVLVKDFAPLRKSANGAPAAKLLAEATTRDEVVSILRINMGDRAARDVLRVQNAKLSQQVDMLFNRNAIAGHVYNGMSAAEKASVRGQKIKADMDAQSKQIARLDSESRIISDRLKAFDMMSAMHFNRITTPAGLATRRAFGAAEGKLRPVRKGQRLPDQGIVKTVTNVVYNGTIGLPIKLAHTYSNIRPTHYIDVKDADSWKMLDASLQDVKGLSREGREMYVSQYLKANPNERALELAKIEQAVTHRIVDRYNLGRAAEDQIDYAVANGLYRELAERRGLAQASMGDRSYSHARIDDPANPGMTIKVDEIDGAGGQLVVSPVLTSHMAASHIITDFELFEKAIKTHGSEWQKAMNTFGSGWTKTVAVADQIGAMWKFAQLFRIAYGPRALADDFLGQVARFGFFDMVARTVRGGKYAAQDFHNLKWNAGRTEQARLHAAVKDTEIEDLVSAQLTLEGKIESAVAKGVDPEDIAVMRADHASNAERLAAARAERSDLDSLIAYGQGQRHTKVGRQIFDPHFAGTAGALFKDLSSGQRNFENLIGATADHRLAKMRSMDWHDITPTGKGGEAAHLAAWKRVLNNQIANDALAVKYLSGASDASLMAWFRTAEGKAYLGASPLKSLSRDDLLARVKAVVDEVANPVFPGSAAIRSAARTGSVTDEMLKGVPIAGRPPINAQRLNYALGNHPVAEMMDNGMNAWYNLIAQTPSRKLLRHPLFGQQYKMHLADSMRKMGLKGQTHIDEGLRREIQESARIKALDDVKKTTFTMDHETRMAYMLRNYAAFFGAQQESWNRWARIISEQPHILARVPQVYGAPTRAGMTVDQNGNPIDGAGYATDPNTGEKTLVDYADRRMLIQIPEELGGKAINKFLGLDEDAEFVIPLSSAELILNHGDGAVPVGVGPYVQIAANDLPFTALDAKGDPKLSDMYQKLGVLPFGVQESWIDFFKPTTLKRVDAADEMSSTYQANLWRMMQAETAKYDAGLREKPPTWDELHDRATTWSWARTAFANALPLSVNAQDPYQYFRDEFRRMQALDPATADQKFYDKYGDSFYIFAQSRSKNNSGVQPTVEGVKMSKYYQDLIDKIDPELAGIVVGAEGEGVYSQGAYRYQQNMPISNSTTDTHRGEMSAAEAKKASDRARGWMQYQSYMNDLYARMLERGFETLDSPGAEDLLAERRALVEVLTSPRLLNDAGEWEDNPHYNRAWEEAWNSLDKGHYDRQAQDLRTIVDDPEIWAKAVDANGNVGIRSDIYTLRTYLDYRDELQKALILRKRNGGSDDINAQSNEDLKRSWNGLVMKMIESDTKFGDLHSRRLATDMGFNMDTAYTQERQAELEASTATITGTQASEEETSGPDMFTVMDSGGGLSG